MLLDQGRIPTRFTGLQRKSIMKNLFGLALCLLGLAQPASAAIIIGQTAAFTGGPASAVKEMTLGAKLVIDKQNAAGGVNGEQIELVSMDDGFKPDRAVANAKALISEKKIVAMLLTRGTPTAEAMIPILNQHGVPLIAPSTGAISLHSPVQPMIFNLRSTYQVEAKKMITQFCTMAMCQNIAIIHVDDSFGRDALAGADQGFKLEGSKAMFTAKFNRETNDLKEALAQVKAFKPKAVIVIASSGPSVTAVKEIRKIDKAIYIATLSTNANAGFVKEAGVDGRDVIVAQVFPRESALDIPLVREGRKLLADAGRSERLSPAMMEGMAGARLLISALQKTPSPVTSKKLLTTLNSGTSFDIGWPRYDIKFRPDNHSGTTFIDLSRIAEDGRFQR